ncbi:DUF5990 family protein [Streptomyces sp. NPDC097619]|uniref:DUF5990 family protein n=1 Tax=Streptomyces sp. NPDC097619 TaxID=3157228 RepID=UPI00332689B1
MRIRIEGFDLPGRTCPESRGFPGFREVHVAVQPRARDGELLAPQRADADSVSWELESGTRLGDAGIDWTGAWILGRPGARFLYLSWTGIGADGFPTRFRRAKLMLDAVDPAVAEAALERGLLVARLRLTDAQGAPLCAAVRPPAVEWACGPAF